MMRKVVVEVLLLNMLVEKLSWRKLFRNISSEENFGGENVSVENLTTEHIGTAVGDESSGVLHTARLPVSGGCCTVHRWGGRDATTTPTVDAGTPCLGPELVRAARKEEMDFMKYSPLRRSSGCGVLGPHGAATHHDEMGRH